MPVMGDIEQSGVVVLRPEVRRYASWLARYGAGVITMAAVYIGFSAANVDSAAELWLIIGLVVGSIVVVLGGVVLSIRTTSVRLGPSRVEHRRWWVRTTVLDTSGPVEGVLARHVVPFARAPAVLLLVVRRSGEGPRIRLSGYFWTTQDLEKIADHVGIVPTSDALTTAGFEARAEHLMRWRDRHPYLFGIVIAALITVVIIVLIFAALLAQGLPPFD